MHRVRCADRGLASQANQYPVCSANPSILTYSLTRLLAYSPFHPLGRVVAHRWAHRWHASAGLAGGSKRASRLLAIDMSSTPGLGARVTPCPASEPHGQATCIPNALAEKPARPDLVGPYELLRTARDQVVPAGHRTSRRRGATGAGPRWSDPAPRVLPLRPSWFLYNK